MRLFRLPAITLFILGGLLLAQTPAPKLIIKSDFIDFGEIESGAMAKVVFEFENAGNAPLEITSITPSCGCTVAKSDKTLYKPGEKGQIPVSFNSSGYVGRTTKSLTLNTTDPTRPQQLLRFTGNVIQKNMPKAELVPGVLNFGKVRLGSKNTRELILANKGSADLRVIECIMGPETSLEFSEKVVLAGKTQALTLTFRAMEKGRFTQLIRIRTSDFNNPYQMVRIDAEIE
jgi:hypothetical protein